MKQLWINTDRVAWLEALASYEAVIDAQGSDLLARLDPWYRLELPPAIKSRDPRRIEHLELVRVVEWKMARGVWRARNLHLARANQPEVVESASAAAFAASEDRAALRSLGLLQGVGPATASAVLAANDPGRFPFFDDLVAIQLPGLVAGQFTVKSYLSYAELLRTKAAELGDGWSAQEVGLALWANSGGKPLEGQA